MTIEQLADTAASFLGWQCRLRQHAVRRSDGRPSQGMCPRALLDDGQILGPIVTVLVRTDPAHAIAQFRHVVRKTHDPLERYEAAVRILQTTYYQHPKDFSDQLTALFAPDSPAAASLLQARHCTLDFHQGNQRFTVPCSGRALEAESPFYQATYWHNAMFNPKLSGAATVLQFVPDWTGAVAELS